ncbi:MAG: hypothetical protein WKG07_21405 [Hymenobacter sp.]
MLLTALGLGTYAYLGGLRKPSVALETSLYPYAAGRPALPRQGRGCPLRRTVSGSQAAAGC